MANEQSSDRAELGTLELGKYYKVRNPADATQECVVMTEETWANFGTHLESFRALARKQDVKLKETQNLLAVAQRQLGDALERLNNLRDIRRAEKRPEVEAAVHELLTTEGSST